MKHLQVDWDEKRRQLLDDGVCIIENVLDDAMLESLRSMARAKLGQLSDRDRAEQKSTGSMIANRDIPELAELIAWPRTLDALGKLGFDDIRFSRAYLISKPPHSPQLFWHQDFTVWSGEPRAYSDASPLLFAMFYLVDTNRENGCLRILPGSHRKRHELHGELDVAHTAATRRMDDPDSPLYGPADGEVDVPTRAGDLVLGDGRALHAAHANRSDHERSVITIWYHPMFSDLQEGTQRQITDLARAECEHWPEDARRILEGIIANYDGSAAAIPRDRVPGSQLK
jgi:hypothetical protein